MKQTPPISVAVFGAGYAARGLICQILATSDIQLVALCNRTKEKAQKLLDSFDAGHIPITDKPDEVWEKNPDVIVDATGSIEYGLDITVAALERNIPVVGINAELEALMGPYFSRYDAVYTQAYGDQPGVLLDLYREITGLGLKPVLLGNIKSILDHSRTPGTQKKWAQDHNQSPILATEAADGTKLALEMTTVANATASTILSRGMLGKPAKTVYEAVHLYRKHLTPDTCVVEYILGAQPAFGVFAIGHTDTPILQEYLSMYKMGEGPYYLFYRPYHLCTIEAVRSIRNAVRGIADMAPLEKKYCDAIAVAKRDIPAGHRLDGIGGFDVYGLIEKEENIRKNNILPVSLSSLATTKKTITKGSAITLSDISVDQSSPVYQAYKTL